MVCWFLGLFDLFKCDSLCLSYFFVSLCIKMFTIMLKKPQALYRHVLFLCVFAERNFRSERSMLLWDAQNGPIGPDLLVMVLLSIMYIYIYMFFPYSKSF